MNKKPIHHPARKGPARPAKRGKPFGPNPNADRHSIEHWVAQTIARAAELRFINMPRAADVLTDWANELAHRAVQL